jgi:hypothetical protein
MVEQVLLVLRIAFVILLYQFIWRVVRLSLRDVRRGHESMVLSPGAAASAGLTPLPVASVAPAAPGTDGSGRLVVVRSPGLPAGTVVVLEHDVVFGRAEDADAVLDGDTTASSRHARVFRRGSQVYVEDLSSTNGTYVNGRRLAAERALRSGDVVVVGATEMRFEQAA